MKSSFPVFLFSIAALISSSDAASIMFDFGPTAVLPADAANSPWRSVDASAGTSWNQITGADNNPIPDVPSGLIYSDGSAATGVGFNFGTSSTGALQTVNLATQPTRSANLAGTYNSGIYAGTSVGRDAVFLTTSVAIGAQITGLAAGTYDIYVTSRNTSYNTNAYTQTLSAGAGVAGQNFDYSSYLNSTVAYAANAATPTLWTLGATYMKVTVTLTDGQALNLAVIGENSGAVDRGFFNSIQIVSVPEPSAALVFCGLLGASLFRRKVA